jgi:azurin
VKSGKCKVQSAGAGACLHLLLFIFLATAGAQESAPQVFLDKSPAVVRYQLKRLTNEQLLALERKPDDPKYKPVYEAILTRRGLAREVRIEAAEALAKIQDTHPAIEMILAIQVSEEDDHATRAELGALALTRPAADLTRAKDALAAVSATSTDPGARSIAYAAFAMAHESAGPAWELAGKTPDGRQLLLGAVRLIPDPRIRATFRPMALPLVMAGDWNDPLAIAALGSICFIPGNEEATFKSLAWILRNQEGEVWPIAVQSIRHIPAQHWPRPEIEPLARTVIGRLTKMDAQERASPSGVEAAQLGYELAEVLPPAAAAPLRKSLRELGVRTVLIRTLREQMLYDLRYFVVEAGKPVQIVLRNEDSMPHNLVVIAPGSLLEIGAAAAAMPAPAVNDNRAYVPDNPKVLHSSRLINANETDTLSFHAPSAPGQYIYVCTFPGHFTRMYGVMLVVEDIEAWERHPKAPTDPLLNTAIESPKHQAGPMDPPHEH